jgi:hypothetical protein
MMDLVVLNGTRRHALAGSGTALTARLMGLALLASCGVEQHAGSLPGLPASGGQPAFGSGGSFVPGTGGRASSSSGSGGSGVAVGSGGAAPGAGNQASGGASGFASGGSSGPASGTGGGATNSGTGGQTVAGGSGTGGAAAPLSGAGVMINGTFVPKEKAIVFIHFGHSNMRGMATTPASLHSYFYDTQPGLWSYEYQGNDVFTLAKEPTAPEAGFTAAGPGMALLKTAAAAVSADSGYQFISIGRGISSDTTVDYLPTGLVYPSFITNRAKHLVGKVTFGAVFVMLGITERHLPAAEQPGYPGRVQTIIAAIRADLGEPNLPVLYCDYEQNAIGTLAPTGSVGVVILPLTRMLPGLISNLVLVPTDNIPRADYEDDHHFNMTGHQIWAGNAIGLMQTKGWFPWK